jgi:hypothetical protein
VKNKEMKALSLDELEMVSGGVDDTTEAILELIGKIVDWFNS